MSAVPAPTAATTRPSASESPRSASATVSGGACRAAYVPRPRAAHESALPAAAGARPAERAGAGSVLIPLAFRDRPSLGRVASPCVAACQLSGEAPHLPAHGTATSRVRALAIRGEA